MKPRQPKQRPPFETEGDVPDSLADLARMRGARRVRAMASGLFVVEIATRSADNGPIFLRVNLAGEQVEFCKVTRTLHRTIECLSPVWPVSEVDRAKEAA